LHLRAESAGELPRKRTAVIFLWIRGRCSHLDPATGGRF
jgi:hypothetical protein